MSDIPRPDYLVVVDAGHGETIAAVYNLKTGSRKSLSFPSMRARVTGETMGLGKEQEHIIRWSEWQGRRYAMGFDALQVRRDNLERHSGETRYGGELQKHLVAHAQAIAGIKSGSVDLTVFVPPKFYRDLKDSVVKRFLDETDADGYHVTLGLMGDKKARRWKYTSVTVLPEGLAGGLILATNADGTLNKNDLLNSTVIFDLGMKTCDAVEIAGGKFNPDNLQYATFENEGLREQLFQPLLEDIRAMHRDFQILTVDDVDLFVREGLTSGRVVVDFAGQQRDVTDNYHYWRQVYANRIANNVIDERYRGLKGYGQAVFHGGGYALTFDHFRAWYGDKVLDTSKYPHVAKVKPLDWNIEGGLRRALANARKQGWVE